MLGFAASPFKVGYLSLPARGWRLTQLPRAATVAVAVAIAIAIAVAVAVAVEVILGAAPISVRPE